MFPFLRHALKDQANLIEADGTTAYQTAFVGGKLFQNKSPRLDSPASLAQKDILLLDDTSRLFGSVALSLEHIEEQQINRIQSLAQNTSRKTAEITRILKGSQLPAPRIDNTSAVGGPFIAADDNQAFDYSLRGLDQALQQFDQVLNHIDVLPIMNPVSGARISSHFGSRRDPFLKRRAFHAGMDFAAKTGTRVYAAAKGKSDQSRMEWWLWPNGRKSIMAMAQQHAMHICLVSRLKKVSMSHLI